MKITSGWMEKLDLCIQTAIHETLSMYCEEPNFFWHNTRNAPRDRCNTCPSEGDFCAHLFSALSKQEVDGAFLGEIPVGCSMPWLHAEARIHSGRSYPKHDILICNPYDRNDEGNANTLRVIEAKLSFDDLLKKGSKTDRFEEEIKHFDVFEKHFRESYSDLPLLSYLVVIQGHPEKSSRRRDIAIQKLSSKRNKIMLFYVNEETWQTQTLTFNHKPNG